MEAWWSVGIWYNLFMNEKGFLLPLIALLVVVVIGFGAYLLLRTNTLPQISLAPTLQSTPTPSPLVDRTVGWLQFSNINKPYTFKYPTDWALVEDVDKVSVSAPGGKDVIYVVPSAGLEFNAEIKKEMMVNVGGQSVKRIEGTEIISNKGRLIYVGPLTHNGQSFMLVYSSVNTPDPTALVVFDSFVSTFQFNP